MILIATRIAFVIYFFFSIWAIKSSRFPHSDLHFVWLVYLVTLYFIAERLYSLFTAQAIDLSFAFPILFIIYCLNLVGLLLGGQDRLPILNRTEHFAIFVLLAYIVWIFFTKYLPQEVWKEHPYYTALLVLSVTSLLGVCNEIIELIIDQLFATKYIGRHLDTPLDLLMNTLGSGLFLSVRLILNAAEHKRITD
jgi:hypothetical protein